MDKWVALYKKIELLKDEASELFLLDRKFVLGNLLIYMDMLDKESESEA